MLSLTLSLRRRLLPAALPRRYFSEQAASKLRGHAYVDIFPLRLWDFRYFRAITQKEQFLGALRSRLSSIKTHSFTVVDIQPYDKDGGALVTFDFSASDPEDALKTIEDALKTEAVKKH
ncbi:hypothetical protein C8R44DRAFT_771728, partial [Mycena epipterygia]